MQEPTAFWNIHRLHGVCLSCLVFVSSSLSDARRCKLTPALTPTPLPSAPHATYRVITSVSTTRPLPHTHHTLVFRLQMSPSSAQLPTDFTSLHNPFTFHLAPPPGLLKPHIGFICYLRFVIHSASLYLPASVFVCIDIPKVAEQLNHSREYIIGLFIEFPLLKNRSWGSCHSSISIHISATWSFIYRSAFKDEAKLLGRRLVIYFSAHGSLVPGNKMPFMCALCLIQRSKAVQAYIIGGLFLDFFFPLFDSAIHLPAGGK